MVLEIVEAKVAEPALDVVREIIEAAVARAQASGEIVAAWLSIDHDQGSLVSSMVWRSRAAAEKHAALRGQTDNLASSMGELSVIQHRYLDVFWYVDRDTAGSGDPSVSDA